MKNLQHITAMALLVVTAACSNEPVLVDTEFDNIQLKQPEQEGAIIFAPFANRSTRAVPTASDLEFYHNTFKVYGSKTSNEGSKIQPIFEGVTVTANIAESAEDANSWTYETERYWDKQADNYQFIAFAPAHAPIAYQHNLVEVNHETAGFFSVEDYTLIGQNLMEGAPAKAEKNSGFTGLNGADCDIMRSAPFPVTDPKTTPVVNFNFSHTLAKLLLTVKANVATPYVITMNKVTVGDLLSTGTYDHVNGWVAKADKTVNYQYTTPATALSATDKTYFIEVLAMPQAVAATQVVTLDYTITSGSYSEEFTYTTTLADVFAGKATSFEAANSYTVNFNIAPEKNIITFETGVTGWVDTPSDIEID